MTRDQLVPAFMAALLAEGCSTRQIERAVARVRDLPLGASLSASAEEVGHDRALVRAFVFEQTRLLERAG